MARSVVLDGILFILAGNDDIDESLDEFEFGQIRPLVSMTTDRVIMAKTVPQLFFIRSFSYLQIIMICMRTLMSSKFGHIRPQTAELATLECLKKKTIDL